MIPGPLRVLILEDEAFDAELEIATLEEAGYVCQWERVETRAEFLTRLDAPNYDIILADYNLPAFDGLTALQLLLERDLNLPFVLVSGTLGEETAIESLKAGATDYVLKSHLTRLGPVVKRALREYEERRQRQQAEEEQGRLLLQVQEQAQRVRQIMDTVPEGVIFLDNENRAVLANPLGQRDLATLADAKMGDTLTHMGDKRLTELLTSLSQGSWHEINVAGRIFQIIARPIEVGPADNGWVLVIRDMTHQRETERRIQQQERLAAVGQLAAGIAHDFNNIMASIVLYAQMTARTEGLPARVQERMETINRQAQHATRLIQQILDFSRQATLKRRSLDLLLLLKEQVKLLERTLPEDIKIELVYDRDEYIVDADPTRMQQVMMNLALNARDAMPNGGQLLFKVKRMAVGPGESPVLPEIEAGTWIQLSVSDTGTGIPPSVLPHIFDPFFTTKAPGEGSGLGLAQVHGIVGQHGGRVNVDTQVDKGTTFTIYLPALLANPVEAPKLQLFPSTVGKGELVLVVEDEATVRSALVESLNLLKYQVLEAANAREALMILEAHHDEIALVLSDVVMPEMGGIALFHALKQKGSSVPMVLLTGHLLDKTLDDLYAQGLSAWLPKPPSFEQLAQVVAKALSKNIIH
ncbi:MAG TPA: response regulator [Anaerolineae bacterium]|nr:response regulator [Anaerolineae bacterium]